MSIRVRLAPARGEPAEFDFDGPDVVIGRAASAALVLADNRVSRQHARLTRRADGWWVEDLGARNPTLLNGEPVGSPAKLRPGDRLQVGDSVLSIVGDESGTAAAAPATTIRAGPGGGDAARLWTINEIHKALSAPLPLRELLDVILARCFDVLGPEEGAILLRGGDGEFSTAASRRDRGPGGPVSVPRRLIAEVAGKAQPTLSLDALYDDRFAGSESIVSSGIRSIVAAPLTDAEGTLGLITLGSRVGVRRFTQSDLDMLVSIASAAALRVRNAALVDELAERRVVEHELALAHEVQMSMLPRALPARRGVSLGARLKPARSVGGDLYDVVLDGDRLWFIVADVAGKSIAAALYVAIVRTLFQAMSRSTADVETLVGRMNRELCRDNDRAMFVTAAAGCLDLRTGVVSLVDAGHLPAILLTPEGRLERPAVSKGIALGVIDDAAYAAAELTMERGATLVFYTDGVTEARAAGGEMFGLERLEQAVAAALGRDPASLAAQVIDAVESFAAGAPPDDDLTLLALGYDRPSA